MGSRWPQWRWPRPLRTLELRISLVNVSYQWLDLLPRLGSRWLQWRQPRLLRTLEWRISLVYVYVSMGSRWPQWRWPRPLRTLEWPRWRRRRILKILRISLVNVLIDDACPMAIPWLRGLIQARVFCNVRRVCQQRSSEIRTSIIFLLFIHTL